MPSSRIASVGTTLPHTTDSPIDMTPPVGGGGAVLQEYRQNRTVSMLKMNQGIRVIPSRIVRSTHWEALCRPTSPTAPPPGSDNCVIARLPVLVAGLTDQRIDRSVEKRTGLRHNAVPLESAQFPWSRRVERLGSGGRSGQGVRILRASSKLPNGSGSRTLNSTKDISYEITYGIGTELVVRWSRTWPRYPRHPHTHASMPDLISSSA